MQAQPIPFDTLTPERFEDQMDCMIRNANRDVDHISKVLTPTYSTVLQPLDVIVTDINDFYAIGSHLEVILGSPGWRESMTRARSKVTGFITGIPLNRTLYRALLQIDADALGAAQQRHLQQTLQTFRLSGAELDDTKQSRLASIEQRLNAQAATFASHVVGASDDIKLEVKRHELDGMPTHEIKNAIKRGQHLGYDGPVLSGDAVCFRTVMRFCRNRRVREALWRLYYSRGCTDTFDNRPLIQELLALRREKAGLFGYDNIIQLRLQTRMVASASQVDTFLENLSERSQSAAEAEHLRLVEFIEHELEQPEVARDLMPWDVDFYSEILRERACGFDESALHPYTSLPSLLEGLFSLAYRLFDVRFKPMPDIPKWHEDVLVYGVWDRGDAFRGYAYMDLHPRQGKRPGAWMYPLVHSTQKDMPISGVMAANLSRGTDGNTPRLDHREMCTLYHEFGHLLHHLLSDIKIGSLAGTNVAWDFVELPSQILENWCWSNDALSTLLVHEEDGLPAPDALIRKLVQSRTYRAASGLLRQVSFATLDFKLHRIPLDEDPLAEALEHARGYSLVPLPETYSMITSFGHLFSSAVGYSAGYYAYLWAQMLEADAFERFEEEGVFSSETGRHFRETILATGNMAPAMTSFVSFRGNEPSEDALLRRLGLMER